MEKVKVQTYNKNEAAIFRSTKATFGGLSNMASGYTIFVNGVMILSSEALYQALKFTSYPDIQHKIISQKSPMTAKMISRKHNDLVRPDWNDIRIDVMRWCLMVKLSQNWDLFSEVLNSTGDAPIVEYSTKDKVWAAIDKGNGTLEGANVLGRLLMELRHIVKTKDRFECVRPLDIPDFLLYENEIEWVCDETNDIFDLGEEEAEEHRHLAFA